MLKFFHDPYKLGFAPDIAALVMRLQGTGNFKPFGTLENGDTSLQNRRGFTSETSVHKSAKQARACQSCNEVCITTFVNFEEDWDLIDLGEESRHDRYYKDTPRE